jgi:N-acetylglutamate synthase-like GNAT family acetyltransferase
VSAFRPRDTKIFHPYPDEIPWELLPDEAAGQGYPEHARMRVAKLGGQVIGVYVIEPVDPLSHRLLELVVAPNCRSQGLGQWLLGHAIGLAESKGAREIVVRGQSRRRFFAKVGFEPDGADLKLTLTPE